MFCSRAHTIDPPASWCAVCCYSCTFLGMSKSCVVCRIHRWTYPWLIHLWATPSLSLSFKRKFTLSSLFILWLSLLPNIPGKQTVRLKGLLLTEQTYKWNPSTSLKPLKFSRSFLLCAPGICSFLNSAPSSYPSLLAWCPCFRPLPKLYLFSGPTKTSVQDPVDGDSRLLRSRSVILIECMPSVDTTWKA